MTNRQRLLLLVLLFAAASFIFVFLSVRVSGPGYTITPAAAIDLYEAQLPEPGELFQLDDRIQFERPLPEEAYPLVARQGDRLALLRADSVAVLERERYAVLGDRLIATGGHEDDEDSVRLISGAGVERTVEGAQRVWSRGSRALALTDGGRRFADVSEQVFAEDPDGVENGEPVHIVPRWQYANAPLTAATAAGERTVMADALGGMYVLRGAEDAVRTAPAGEGGLSNVLALSGVDSGTTLYAVGGVSPTRLVRFTIDEQGSIEPVESVELPHTVRQPPRITAIEEIVAIAYDGHVFTYDSDLEPLEHRELGGVVSDMDFFSNKRLLYVTVEKEHSREVRGSSQVNIYYADDLSSMYSLDFSSMQIYSVRASAGGMAVGTGTAVLLYREVAP